MAADFSPEKLLSICLPSFNRSKYITAQVEFLCNFLNDNNLSSEIEVIVSNNQSTDSTLSDLSALPYSNFVIHTHPEHYPTAEENIFRSVDLCSGSYVWFLGDDDPVNFNNLLYCIEQLKSKKRDCLLFNSMTTKNDGSIALSSPVTMEGEYIDLTVPRLVEAVGFLNTFAGISNLIVKRELLDVTAALRWLGISPIYSHVAWFVECLTGKTVTLYNSSLVRYRQAAYKADHWPKMAESLNVPSRYFWSIGLIKLFKELISHRTLTHSNVANIHDVAADGRRYRLLDEMCFNIFQQLECYGETLSRRECLSDEDLVLFRSFIISADPAYFDIANRLVEGHSHSKSLSSPSDIRRHIKAFSETFPPYFNNWVKESLFGGQFIGVSNGYNLYRTPTNFVGVHVTSGEAHQALTTVGITGDGYDVVTGTTRQGLLAFVKESAQKRRERALFFETEPEHQVADVRADNAITSAELTAAYAELRAVRESTSWRITAPLRKVATLFKRQ